MPRAVAVFVHGILSDSSSWEPMATLLRQDQLLSVHFAFNSFVYPSPPLNLHIKQRTPNINAVADTFATYMELRLREHERVVILAHSQGGLVVQRYLARQLSEGKGEQLAKIRRIMLFGCPNTGSEFLLTLRRTLPWRHRQERELRPFSELVTETQRRVLSDVVYSTHLEKGKCPIPVYCYAGDSDNVVSPSSAKSVFPSVGVLPGNHHSLIVPTGPAPLVLDVVREGLREALDTEFPSRHPSPDLGIIAGEAITHHMGMTTHGPLHVRFNPDLQATTTVYVHSGPADRLKDVDIIAISENVYMQMAMTYKPSASGRLRRAAASKGPAGEIIDDTAYDELVGWMKANGRFGLPVEAGTVAATSSGALIGQNVRRLYHVAVSVPVAETDRFVVNPTAIGMATHNIFSLARRERVELGLPLKSIAFSLFGAGVAGLDPMVSLEWIWAAISEEVRVDNTWDIHVSTWSRSETVGVLSRLRKYVHEGEVMEPLHSILPQPGDTSLE